MMAPHLKSILTRPAPATLALLLLLSGCAGVMPDGGFSAVQQRAAARAGLMPQLVRSEADAQAVADTVRALLAQPLSADAAVRIALLNHPGLQAQYWQVGLAEADLAQAARLQNPRLSFQRLRGGGALEIDRSLSLNLLEVLTLPLARRIEAERYEQVKLAIGASIEQHAYATRRAWVEAVAAQQRLTYARQVNAATAASAGLRGRMARSGNSSKLDLAREQLLYAQASAQQARAERDLLRAREALVRLLGLWGADASFTLPARLPALPLAATDLPDLEPRALAQRLDIAAARQQALATAASLGLTRSTRLINVLELSVDQKSQRAAPAMHGYTVTLELPLFDWGQARVAHAEALYMQALRRLAEQAVTVRSEAREHYLGYRSAFDLARHYRDQVLPLRKQIAAETLLRYNGMLASSFDLLADARDQAEAVNAYITALEDFWRASVDLEQAIGGPLTPAPSTTPASSAAPSPAHAHHESKEHQS